MSHRSNTSPRNIERRRFERIPVEIGANAVVANTEATFECTILDISEGGVKLEIPEIDIVPVQFKLYVPETDLIYACEIVWRDGRYVGLKFVGDTAI
ncbi:MAG: PilZ domain-containing protein [Rhizobiaceae bacterium]